MAINALPLPPNPLNDRKNPFVYLAYEKCRVAEEDSTGLITKTRSFRVLGYLLLNAPTLNGRFNLALDIMYCYEDQDRLYKLGEFYTHYLILNCRFISCSSKLSFITSDLEGTPVHQHRRGIAPRTVLPHLSNRRAFDKMVSTMRDKLDCPPADHDPARVSVILH